jgi:hypothetical protein
MSDVDHGIKLLAVERAIHGAIIWGQTRRYLSRTLVALGGDLLRETCPHTTQGLICQYCVHALDDLRRLAHYLARQRL